MQTHEGIKDNEDGFIQSSQLYKISTARIAPKHLSCLWNENQRQVCAGPQTDEAPHTESLEHRVPKLLSSAILSHCPLEFLRGILD